VVDGWRLAGTLIGAPLGLLARWRRGKPMHPRGAVFTGVLERRGAGPVPWGAPWLDEPAVDDVVVRLSRGFGLPERLPDLLGLAVRVPGEEPVDLLLTSAGLGRFTRFLLLPRRDPACGYGSLMGYRSDAGTLRFAAIPEWRRPPAGRPLRFTLAAAPGRRPLRPFARLTLTAPADPIDPDVRFDAVLHPPPGLVPDGPLARVRAPAYALARRSRG